MKMTFKPGFFHEDEKLSQAYTLDREILMLKIICAKNFCAKFLQFRSIHTIF